MGDMTTGAGGVGRGYRPWLDGLRAVAVALVVLEHANRPAWLAPGSTGVGLFFGLSGYLITGMLLDERANEGHIALRDFYVRRLARLAPALAAMVCGASLLLVLIGSAAVVVWAVPAMLYVTNYLVAIEGGFPSAFGPTWSLAVEEHFYLVWPLVILLVLRRFSLRALLRIALLVCAVAPLWRLLLVHLGAPPLLLAVGSFERSDALMYGCAGAIGLRLGWRPRSWLLPTGVLVVLSVMTLPALWGPVVGQAVLGMGSAAVAVGLDCGRGSRVRQLLGTKPFVRLGVLSYGIYLWHDALIGAVRPFGPIAIWAAVTMSVLIAAVSHRWVEAPARAAVRRRLGGRGTVLGDPNGVGHEVLADRLHASALVCNPPQPRVSPSAAE